MNKITATLTATIAIISFSACTAQQRQMINNVTRDEPAVETTLPGDPPVQGPCEAGENVVDGVCLPAGTTTPPPTQPVEDPNAPLTCPPGEVLDVDPAPHCILD